MPAANFYRGGLAFFTNNTADVSTNAVERMRIDQSGNVGIGTFTPSSTLDVSGDLSVQGQSTFNSNATMSYGASLDFNNDQNQLSGKISVSSSKILDISNSEGVSIPSDVKGNLTLTTGYLSRDTPDSSGSDVPHGYLVGNYIFDASYVGKKSYPIFALDDNSFKQPSHTSLGDFYGIGYTQNNNTFISAGDPSSNWGMYVSAEGKVGSFIDGGQGADSFFNPEGGKVGIGTKGPSQKLDVNGNILANSYLIDNTKGIFGGPGNAQLLLSVNGAQSPALRVLSNSNIAIGHDDGAPSLLTIGNSINSNSSHDSTAFDSGTKILLGNQGSNTTGEDGSYYVIGFGAFESSIVNSPAGKYPAAYIGYQQQGYIDQTGYGDLVFGTKDNTGKAGTEATERMRITKDGRIGIANSNPQATLHVKGEVVIDSDVSIGSSINDGRLTIKTPGNGTGPNPNFAANKALSIIDANKNGTYVNIGTSSYGTSAAFGLNWFNSNTNIANPTDVDNALVLTCFKGHNKVGLNTIPWGYEYDPILHIESKFNNGDPGINGGTMLQHPQVLIAANPTDPGAGNNNQYATLELKGSYVGSNGSGSGTITYGAGIRVGYGDIANRYHGNLELYTTEPSSNERKTRLTVGNNGNVGIGTNSPNAKLEIIGDTGNRPLAIENTFADYPSILCRGSAISNNSYNFVLNGTLPGTSGYTQNGATHFINGPSRNDDNGPLTYTIRNDSGDLALGGVGDEPGIYIARTSRNVGIGTYPSNPSAKLNVQGDYSTGDWIKCTYPENTWSSPTLYNNTYFFSTENTGSVSLQGSGFNEVKIGPGGIGIGYEPPAFARGGADSLVCSGKVGIGTNSPSAALEVNGDINFTGNLIQNGTAYSTTKWTTSSTDIYYNTGNVGIGTTNPEYPLHVNSSKADANNESFVSTPMLWFYPTQPQSYGGTGTLSSALIQYQTGSPVSITGGTSIYTVGAIVSEVGIAAGSDKRIKTNIIDVPDNLALEQVRNIDVRYYEYKDKVKKGTEKTIGFIAQQVKEIVPSAVSIQKNIIPNEMRIIESPSWTTITDSSGINTYKLTISDLSDNSGNTLYRFYVVNDLSGNDVCQKEIKSLDTEPKSFIFKEKWTNVFLYGKQVDDFHILDKQKLFAVNFSATQEIDRIQQGEKTKLKAAESKIVTLENEVSTLKTQLAQVLARLDALENSN